MSENTNELQLAGDVNIEFLEIISSKYNSINIRNQVVEINIYEDIFSPFITGTLVVKDALDLVNFFPLVGDETLKIKLSTPGFISKTSVIELNCKIYKMTDREMVGNRVVAYMLHFISSEAIMDLNIKLSKAYTGNISEIAYSILKEYSISNDERFHIEPTINAVTYISNYWSPVKNLNYLAEHAISNHNSPTFLFFENRNGLNFVSLGELYTYPVVRSFICNDYSRDYIPNSDGNIRNIEKDFSQVIDVNIPVAFDYIDRITNGAFASTLITHDITTKTYMYRGFDFLTDYETDKRLNKYPLISKNIIHSPAAAIATMHKANGVLSGNNDITNSKIFQKRRSLLALADSAKIEITVLGRTDYTVGQKINVNFNQIKPIDVEDKDIDDKVFSGDYIIAAIKHFIDRTSHKCIFELIKDSTNVVMEAK